MALPGLGQSGHADDIAAAVSRDPSRTKGVTTTAPAPRTRADTNGGPRTVDHVGLATRHKRAFGARRAWQANPT
jgi:hypothetical protein